MTGVMKAIMLVVGLALEVSCADAATPAPTAAAAVTPAPTAAAAATGATPAPTAADNATAATPPPTVAATTDAATCSDVAEGSDASCAKHAMWAMKTGVLDHKDDWYKNWPDVVALNASVPSTLNAWQCVLYHKTLNGENNAGQEGHNCTMPCNYDNECVYVPPTPAPTAAATAAATAAPATGFPVWGWVLLALGFCCGIPLLVLCCGAFLCYEAVAFILDPIMGGKKGAQKKKRAVKKVAEPEAPAAAAPVFMPAPVYTTSVPMPVYQAAPMVTYAAPHLVQAQPVYATQAASVSYAAPAVTYAPPASVSYAAEPAVTYAAPAASYSYAASAMPYTGEVITHHVDGHTSQHAMQ